MARRLAVVDVEKCVGCQLCMFACSRRHGVAGIGRSAIEVRSAGGLERGFRITVCRACEDPPCARHCPTGALEKREGGGVKLREDLCIGCQHCVEACTIRAIFWDWQRNKPVVCIYCGYCAKYCPHEVLALEEI